MSSQNFKIDGLSCQACVKYVTQKLEQADAFENIQISSDLKALSLESQRFWDAASLNTIIDKERYTVFDLPQLIEIDAHTQSKASTYRPLIISFLFVLLLSVLMAYTSSSPSFMDWMRYFMGVFFLLFSLFKHLDLKGFASSFRMYDPLAKRWGLYAWIYPFIETSLGIAYVINLNSIFMNALTIVVLGITTLGVVETITHKQKIQCACIGSIFNLPMSKVTLIENSTMMIMAAYMLITALF